MKFVILNRVSRLALDMFFPVLPIVESPEHNRKNDSCDYEGRQDFVKKKSGKVCDHSGDRSARGSFRGNENKKEENQNRDGGFFQRHATGRKIPVKKQV